MFETGILFLSGVSDETVPDKLKQVKRALEQLTEQGKVRFDGINRWRRYSAVE